MKDQEHNYDVEQDIMKNQIFPLASREKAHLNSIESIAAHPSFKSFATGSHDKTIKLWDVGTFKETTTLAEHKEGVWALDYNQDGTLLASGGPDSQVLLWDTKKNTVASRLNGHTGKVYVTRFNENSKILVSAGQFGELLIWDLANTKAPFKTFKTETNVIYDAEWSKGGDYLFATTFACQLLTFNSKTFEQISRDTVVEDPIGRCESVAANFKLIEGRLYCGTSQGKISWYQMNPQTHKLTKETEFLAHMDACRNVSIHPHKRVLLSSGRDGSARIWNARSNDKHPLIAANLVLHQENVTGATFLGDQFALTGSWDQKIGLWKITDLVK